MTLTDSWTPPETNKITLPDGRRLQYCLYGPEHAPPVVCHAGTPGTCLLSPTQVELIEHIGVRVLIADRPGYGDSTTKPYRSIADVVMDIAFVTGTLGWKSFGTWGASGGGPHALACAALLPERVTRCATVGSLAPYGAKSLEWFKGMSPGNIDEFEKALVGETVYRPFVEDLSRQVLDQVERREPAFPSGYDMPQADIEEMRRRQAEDAPGRVERARRTWGGGIDGWVDDCIAMVRPWGFDVAEVAVPVSIWYGFDDVLSPRGHAEWLVANIAGSESRAVPGGHILSDSIIADLLRWTAG